MDIPQIDAQSGLAVIDPNEFSSMNTFMMMMIMKISSTALDTTSNLISWELRSLQ